MCNHRKRTGLTAVVMWVAFGITSAASAEVRGAQWVEGVHLCEAVLSEQTDAPLAGLAPAPFTFGKPGERHYAYFAADQSLIIIASLVRREWTTCVVQEAEESPARWRDNAAAWSEALKAGFPTARYAHVKWPYHPDRPFEGAIRCSHRDRFLVIAPHFGDDFAFRVEVFRDDRDNVAEKCKAVRSD